ncbi:GH39 family glycosyl hydrolase [Bacillus sp. B1-b2]|uniref:GH39 family glycosyl hydrolase n=1 Tax=Bacillus sp. B1-b2 TaxID=2653201 RepID=UPI0012627DBF|nr:helix-turn-helix domain-containing protein [Bacillus sp. B1-b2]KAB7668366.1 helix-turn-helix domain-containing protein [Bacillus sp. B1-b2]
MRFSSPWDLVQVNILEQNQILQPITEQIMIIYVIEGQASVCESVDVFHLKREEFIILEPSKVYEIIELEGNVVLISFQYENVFFKWRNHHSHFSGHSNNHHSSIELELSKKLHSFLRIYFSQNEDNDSSMYEIYFGVIAYLEKYFRKKHAKSSSEEKFNARINEVISYLNMNYSREISLSEVAALFYISEPYLSKTFKKVVGISFTQYLMRRRLEGVKKDLETTNEFITTVAFNNGFSNVNSFNKSFKAAFGITPSDYKKINYIKKDDSQIGKNTISVLEGLKKLSPNSEAVVSYKLKDTINTNLEDTITIQANHYKNYTKNWNEIINIGYAADILLANLEQQIGLMQTSIPFKYGRVWGILSDDMIIEKDEIDGKLLNFGKVDRVIEILIKNKMKPFLDLGIKPKMIIGKEFTIHASSFSQKCRTIDEWGLIVKEFVSHCVNKFGYEEVSSWYFELWKPSEKVLNSIQGVKQLDKSMIGNKYFLDYFTVIYRAIKQVASEVKVGGGGFSLDIDEEDTVNLIEKWLKLDVKPDFLTFTIFPLDQCNHTFSETRISSDEHYIYMKIRDNFQYFRELKSDVELIVAEFNCTVSSRASINDSIFKASYLIKNFIENMEHNTKMSYWLFSDIFSYSEDSKRLLFGGTGIISRDGIQKSPYFAFEFLNSLGNQLLHQEDGIFVTRKLGQRLQVLLYHYSHIGAENNFLSEKSMKDDQDVEHLYNRESRTFQVNITGMKKGQYKMKKRVINKKDGSIIDKLSTFEKNHHIKQEEIAYYRSTCLPLMTLEEVNVQSDRLVIKELLYPHEVMLIEVDYIY